MIVQKSFRLGWAVADHKRDQIFLDKIRREADQHAHSTVTDIRLRARAWAADGHQEYWHR